MGAASKRLAIQIDVLDKPDQQALVLADLRPEELINAVLQEFERLSIWALMPATIGL
ncbi:MAG: hypothetical protein IPK16_28495 [Anaerolineales bacterium]|nr:hypothetical protein [Anaerolineales bacterium]